jgi:hypothetical protein
VTDGRPKTVTDEDLLLAIRDAILDGETDPAAGGVHPEVLADRVALSPSTLKDRCRRLREEGRLEKVRGLNPATSSPRWSYQLVETEIPQDS